MPSLSTLPFRISASGKTSEIRAHGEWGGVTLGHTSLSLGRKTALELCYSQTKWLLLSCSASQKNKHKNQNTHSALPGVDVSKCQWKWASMNWGALNNIPKGKLAVSGFELRKLLEILLKCATPARQNTDSDSECLAWDLRFYISKKSQVIWILILPAKTWSNAPFCADSRTSPTKEIWWTGTSQIYYHLSITI